MLEEIRILARKNREERYNDPKSREKDKSYADLTVKFMSNTDYIKEAPKSVVINFLYYLGYKYEQLTPVYDELMKEVNRTYKVVSPEQVAELMKNNENRDHGSK